MVSLMNSTSSETLSTPTFTPSKKASSGLNPTVKKLAFIPLLMAGAMSTQAADTTTTAPATDDSKKTDDVVSLPTVEVQGSKPKELSSPKFTQPLIDTPQTVVVVPKEIYLEQGAKTLSDVLRNTPGITFAAGEGGGAANTAGDSFYLRGFDASNSIFIDGVRDTGAYSRDVFNTDQVEIAKGSAGSDVGRGAASGYINIATKVPQAEDFATGTTSYGFDDTTAEARKRTTVDFNQTLAKSPVPGTAFRFNALWQDGGVTGRQVAENNSWGIAPSLALGLGTPTRLILAYQHVEQHNIPDYGLPFPLFPGYVAPGGTTFQKGIPIDTFYGFKSDYDDVKDDMFTVRLEHDITPDAKLTNQTRYTDTHREAVITAPAQSSTPPSGSSLPYYDPATGILRRSRQATERDTAIFSNQTNFTAHFDTGRFEHDLTSGIEVSRETAYSPTYDTTQATNLLLNTAPFGSPAVNIPNPFFDPTLATPIGSPNPNATPLTPQRNGAAFGNPLGYTDAAINTLATYLFDTIKLSPQWILNGGLRWECYQVNYYSQSTKIAAASNPISAGPPPSNTPANATPAGTFTRLSSKGSGSLLSWKSGLVYKPAPNGSLYVAYGTSMTPPGTNFTLSTSGANNPDSDPQETINYEAGTKWDFLKGRLSTTAAVFETKNSNTFVNDPILGSVPTGEQTVKGIELGITGKITPDWLVFGGVAYLDSVYDTGNAASGTNTAQTGANLPLTPEYSGNLWTTYRFPIGLTLGGGAQYMGETERIDRNTTTAVGRTMPDYWIFNSVASYAVTKHLTLRANVNNVFNEQYVQSFNNNGGRFSYGAPRNYVLSVDFAF